MKHLKNLTRAKITVLIVVLLNCVLCGATMAGVKPAPATPASLAEQICAVTWGAEHRPTAVTLKINGECSWLRQLRPIHRLHLGPLDRRW